MRSEDRYFAAGNGRTLTSLKSDQGAIKAELNTVKAQPPGKRNVLQPLFGREAEIAFHSKGVSFHSPGERYSAHSGQTMVASAMPGAGPLG